MATHSTLLGYLLWLLLGPLGVHRFFFGKRVSGALYALAALLAGGAWALAPRLSLSFGAVGGAWYLDPKLYVPAGIVGLALLVDLFLIPRMKRDMARRYQAGRYSYNTGWVLLLVLGALGAHRFYLGRWRSGLLYLCTLGVLGLGVLYDLATYNDLVSEDNERWISGTPRY